MLYIHYHGTDITEPRHICAIEYFFFMKHVLTKQCELMHAELAQTQMHKHTQDFLAHTMGAALCPKKMKRGAGLGSPTLSISLCPDLTECTVEAR